MEMIPNVQSLISKKVTEERKTHKEISDELKQIYPGVSGLSSRSVRRFCNAHDIHSMSLLTDPDLDRGCIIEYCKSTFMFTGVTRINSLYPRRSVPLTGERQ